MRSRVWHKFEAPLSQDKYSLVVFIFVDDTYIVEVYLTNTEITIEDVYINIHKAIDIWEGVLKETGGAIRPYESFVYPIFFIWDDQGY